MKIKCKIGATLNQQCHKKIFSRKRGLIKFSLFRDEEKEFIQMRSRVSLENNETVCFHHSKYYLVVYEHLQRFCADPKKTHKKKIGKKSCLRPVNLRYAKMFGLIPGQKLCTNCFSNLQKEFKLYDEPDMTPATPDESKDTQPAIPEPEDRVNAATTTTTTTTTPDDSKDTQQAISEPEGDRLNATTTTTTTTTTTMDAIEDVSSQNGEETDIEKKVSSLEYNGSCHCGAVQFKCVAPEKVVVYDCNCSICHMKQNTHFMINKANFTLLTGEDNLTTYQFNTMKAEHMFCKTCGVQSFYIPRSNPDSYGINPRCLKSFNPSIYVLETFDGQNWEEDFAKNPPKSTHL